MPELLIDFITSLDGYAGAEGSGLWGLQKNPSASHGWESSQKRTYTVLMGATTYRLMSGFAAEGEPGTDSMADMSKSSSRPR